MRGPASLDVLAPDGQILLRQPLSLAADQPDGLEIEVVPQQAFSIEPHPDPYQGRRVTLTGRVLDAGGQRAASGLQVFLWARRPESADDAFEVMLATTTDRTGYFSGAYPRGTFAAAFGQVGLGASTSAPVTLEDGRFPRHVVLVVPVPEPPLGEEEACACEAVPPRAPEAVDLVNSPSAYSADLGAGGCVDMTAPNRTIEEFSFHGLVRTTDPAIKGLTLAEPGTLPPVVVDIFDRIQRPLQWARAAQVVAGPIDDPPDGGEVVIGRRNALASAGNGVELDLETLKQQGLHLRPDLLKKVAADPDGFTPEALLTAERLTAFEELRGVLDAVSKTVPGRAAVSAENVLDWDATPTFYQATTVAHGHLLHFKQTWRADGYSLGDLLYSLPLAPCQRKQIAVIDWQRRESAGRTEERTEEERLGAVLSRDRDISEIVDALVTENLRGGSQASTWSVGGGFGLGFLGPISGVLGVAGGGGGASSTAWQDSARRSAGSMLQSLRDRTMQSASAVRSQRASVVQTVRQGEAMNVQTEVVANHNHCHAITVEYFEVLRHFQVSQELVDAQECLFVPLLLSRFDAAKALRWREPLRRFLRDSSLTRAFDALERMRLHYEGSDLPTGSYAAGTLQNVDGELRIAFTIARPRDPVEDEDLQEYFDGVWGFWTRLIGGNPGDVYNAYLREQERRDRIFAEQLAPRIAEAFTAALEVLLVDEDGTEHPAGLDPTLVSDYRLGVSLYVRLAGTGSVPALRREQVKGVIIRTTHELPPHSKTIVCSAYLRYRTAHLEHALARGRVNDDLTAGDDVFLPTPLDRAELRDPRAEDAELARRLLAHLNEHLEHYHKLLWTTMDPDRRYMLLDGFEVETRGSGGRRSLASVVENRLIGIVGNCLVLPVARGFRLDPTYEPGEDGELLDHYAPTTPLEPRRVSVPTSGVFAESVMGRCNSCEVKDDSRFWRPEESPCPGEPPQITGVSAESRRSEPPDLAPSEFPAPMINLQNAPAAPDPTGLGAALALLGTPSLFRDVTGLSENQRNAIAALQSALGTARFFGGEAAKLAHAQGLRQDIDKAVRQIQKAKDAGMITDQQAQSLTESALRGMIGEERQPERRLTDEPEVEQLIRAASEKGGQVKLDRPQDSVDVSVGEGGADAPATAPATALDWSDSLVDTPPSPLGAPPFDNAWRTLYQQVLFPVERETWLAANRPTRSRFADEPSTNVDGLPVPSWIDPAYVYQQLTLAYQAQDAALTPADRAQGYSRDPVKILGANTAQPVAAHYFVLHDSAGTNEPPDPPGGGVHLWIGVTRLVRDRDWSDTGDATKIEGSNTPCFLHVELTLAVAAHTAPPATGAPDTYPGGDLSNDRAAGTLYTRQQYDDLANAYIVASLRAGRLLTVTAHKELDRAGVSRTNQSKHGHNDPRHCDVAYLYERINRKLMMPPGTTYGIEQQRLDTDNQLDQVNEFIEYVEGTAAAASQYGPVRRQSAHPSAPQGDGTPTSLGTPYLLPRVAGGSSLNKCGDGTWASGP